MAKTPVSSAGSPATSHSPLQSIAAHVKLERVSKSPPQLQSQPPITHVKTEPVEAIGLQISALPQHRSPMFESVNELCSLSTAIQEFKLRFDELESHLDSIQAAIESQEQSRAQPAAGDVGVPSKSELHSICQKMCGRSLRKYISSHLNDAQKLREEVPLALKKAPEPAKLVLECFGKFYLQGSRAYAYAKNSPMVSGREASILAVELLLMTVEGEVELDDQVRQEAVQAAMNWKKRLVLEGGIRKASEIDARGLLLFVACYGIPKLFKNEDIWDLVLTGNARQVATALRRSGSLVSRVTEIIEQTLSNGLKQNAKLEAVDVASSFGIDDKFPAQNILTAYLRESKEALKKRRREANNSPTLLKQANERHLTSLKFVVKLLEERNLDPLTVVPGWQLAEEITKLERENADLRKTILEKAAIKKRADGIDMLNQNTSGVKRPRLIGQPSTLISSPSTGLYEEKTASYMMESRSPYKSSSRVNLLAGEIPAYGDTYPCATLASYSSTSGLLPEKLVGGSSFGGREGLMHSAGVDLPAVYNASSTEHGHVANNKNGVPYGLQGVGNVSLGQSYGKNHTYGLFGPSPLAEGFPGWPNSPPPPIGATINPADLFRFADAVVESEYNRRGGGCYQ